MQFAKKEQNIELSQCFSLSDWPVRGVCAQRWPKARFISFYIVRGVKQLSISTQLRHNIRMSDTLFADLIRHHWKVCLEIIGALFPWEPHGTSSIILSCCGVVLMTKVGTQTKTEVAQLHCVRVLPCRWASMGGEERGSTTDTRLVANTWISAGHQLKYIYSNYWKKMLKSYCWIQIIDFVYKESLDVLMRWRTLTVWWWNGVVML